MNTTTFSVDDSIVEGIPKIVILYVLGTLSFLVNGFVAFLFFKYKKIRDQKFLYLLYLSSFYDIFMALSFYIFATVSLYFYLNGVIYVNRLICMLSVLCIIYSTHINQINVCIFNYDRLIAVRKPLEYRNKNHTKFALISCICTLIYSTFGTSIILINLNVRESANFWTLVDYVPENNQFYGIYSLLLSIITSVVMIVLLVSLIITVRKKRMELKGMTIYILKKNQ